jgi:nucleoid-associated protein YgaU
MRFLRVAESASAILAERRSLRSIQLPEEVTPQPSTQTGTAPAQTSTAEYLVHPLALGERLDQLEFRYYGSSGHPSLWRWLALFNNVEDPLHIAPGTPLQIPPLSLLEGKR